MSAHHETGKDQGELADELRRLVVDAVIPSEWIDDKTEFHFNPTGNLKLVDLLVIVD